MSDYWHRAYICPFWAAMAKRRSSAKIVARSASGRAATRQSTSAGIAQAMITGSANVAAAKPRYFDRQA